MNDMMKPKHAEKLTLAPRLSRKQQSMLNIAVKAAQTSELTWKHGAVVVKSGRVLSIGVNKQRNAEMVHTEKEYLPHFTVHAEVDALSRVADARGATIYIARVNGAGEERLSAPCPNCKEALIKAGVKNVIYTVH